MKKFLMFSWFLILSLLGIIALMIFIALIAHYPFIMLPVIAFFIALGLFENWLEKEE